MKKKLKYYLCAITGFIYQWLFGSSPGRIMLIGGKQYMIISVYCWFPPNLPGKKVVQVTVHDPRDKRSHKHGQWAEISPLHFIIVTDYDKIA